MTILHESGRIGKKRKSRSENAGNEPKRDEKRKEEDDKKQTGNRLSMLNEWT